jgi:hypothetical protein
MIRLNMIRINMTRINLFRSLRFSNQSRPTPVTLNSVAWGTIHSTKNLFDTSSPYIFAAALIACSLAVGCSSEQTKTAQTNAPPVTATPVPATPAPQIATNIVPAVSPATSTPTHKKRVHKAPPTLTYADKTTGVSFQYPHRYSLKTGEAASNLVASGPIPMDFTQPGGTTIAAVSLPNSAYTESNLSSAYFNVSVNKTLTTDQCTEFSVPPSSTASPSDPTVQATAQLATPPISKLMIGDMELTSTQTYAGGQTNDGPREESSKYFHVFQNGACYEFAVKVATTEPVPGSSTKPVDKDEVFRRMEKILATVKFNPVTKEVDPEVNASVPTESATPAQ